MPSRVSVVLERPNFGIIRHDRLAAGTASVRTRAGAADIVRGSVEQQDMTETMAGDGVANDYRRRTGANLSNAKP